MKRLKSRDGRRKESQTEDQAFVAETARQLGKLIGKARRAEFRARRTEINAAKKAARQDRHVHRYLNDNRPRFGAKAE